MRLALLVLLISLSISNCTNPTIAITDKKWDSISIEEKVMPLPIPVHITEDTLYNKAQESGYYSAYEDYVKQNSKSAYLKEAKDRIKWLKVNKSDVEVAYPKEFDNQGSNATNWDITLTFKEKSGKIGYKLYASIFDVYSKFGTWYEYRNTSYITVFPGETKIYHIYVNESDRTEDNLGYHVFCNGTYSQNWSGKDAAGHNIKIVLKCKLLHKGCMRDKAFTIAKKFLKEHLRSPIKAVFGDEYKYVYNDLSDQVHYVGSNIKLQDSLGVYRRNVWYVKLKFKGGDWTEKTNWELININLKVVN